MMRVLFPLGSMLGLAVVTGSLGACAQVTTPSTAAAAPIQLAQANPATVHCISIGGESIMHRSSRGEYATCRLRDGSEMEEWRLYRQSFPHLY